MKQNEIYQSCICGMSKWRERSTLNVVWCLNEEYRNREIEILSKETTKIECFVFIVMTSMKQHHHISYIQ